MRERVGMPIASAVSREELEELVGAYRHIRDEHGRARSDGHTRRRLEQKLERVHERFEHLLAALPDEESRRAWREHFHHDAPEPAEPKAVPALLFRGRSAAGSELEIRQRLPGELDVIVDGAEVERLFVADELRSTRPGFTFKLDGTEFRETFRVSRAARAVLRLLVEQGARPLARLRRELLLEGLIDRNLGLTPRGRRALG